MKSISFDLQMKMKQRNDLYIKIAILATAEEKPEKNKALTGFKPVLPRY